MGYIQTSDLLAMTTQYLSAFGTAGVDFTKYTTAQVQNLIDRASAKIDGWCKQTFQLTNATERYYGGGSINMRLRHYPLGQLGAASSLGQASGFVSNSLVVDTTTTGAVAKGATAVPLTSALNILPYQYLQWGDNLGEQGIEIGSVSGSTVNLNAPLQFAHASGARVVVNTIDYMQILQPGAVVFPVYYGSMTVDSVKGELRNYTPLMVQALGYTTTFPKGIPLQVRYSYGYLTPAGGSFPAYPPVLADVCKELCLRLALRGLSLTGAGVTQQHLADWSLSQQADPLVITPELASALSPFNRRLGFR